jgi:hypothetical protein
MFFAAIGLGAVLVLLAAYFDRCDSHLRGFLRASPFDTAKKYSSLLFWAVAFLSLFSAYILAILKAGTNCQPRYTILPLVCLAILASDVLFKSIVHIYRRPAESQSYLALRLSGGLAAGLILVAEELRRRSVGGDRFFLVEYSGSDYLPIDKDGISSFTCFSCIEKAMTLSALKLNIQKLKIPAGFSSAPATGLSILEVTP